MSGGTFNYDQIVILKIAEDLKEVLEDHPENVQLIMREAIHQFQRAFVFAHRMDFYLTGDDSEKDLFKKLALDLADLEQAEEIEKGLKEVKQIRDGEIPKPSIDDINTKEK